MADISIFSLETAEGHDNLSSLAPRATRDTRKPPIDEESIMQPGSYTRGRSRSLAREREPDYGTVYGTMFSHH